MKKLRILYCGYRLTAVKVFEELLSTPEEFEFAAIWTSKDPEHRDPVSLSERGTELGIPVFTGNPRKSERMQECLSAVDVIVCVNYIYILPKQIFERVPYGAINIHGAYLPKYRGRTPNTWAIINGESFCGVTVHIIDEGVDTGPILAQEKVPIELTDTGYTIILKQTELYPKLVRQGLYNRFDEHFTPIVQDHTLASEFPARRPEDGEIDWAWPAERIYNWIRAQTAPYPGAFTIFRGEQVTIWNAMLMSGELLQESGQAGEILGTVYSPDVSGTWVATGDQPLLITSVQRSGDEQPCSPYHLIQKGYWTIGDLICMKTS